MPTQNQDLRYRLLGEDVSAGRTFGKVGDAAKQAHSAIATLGSSLNAAGTFTPLLDGMNAVSEGFEHIQEGGRRSAAVMQGVGIGIAGLGAAFLAVGGKEQQAAAGLKQSIEAAGGSFADYRSAIEETVKQQETFGHSANDTQDALSRLVQATNDPTQAINLMGLAANVAAARHISLTDAATTLAQGLAGNTRAFRQFGISLDGVGSKADQVNRAFDQLNQKLAGQAQAQADTFSGRLRGMATHFEDLVASMSKFTPVLFAVGSAMTVVGAATDMLNKKRAEQVAVDAAVIIGEDGVATAEGKAAIAAAAARTRGLPSLQQVSLAEDAAGARLLSGGGLIGGGLAGLRGNLLKGAGIGVGGLVLGQVASAGIGGTAGSSIGNALSLGGSGAGLGFMVGGPLGAAIGGGVGALGGAVMGLFGGHHGPSHEQQQANLKQVLAQLDQQQTQQLDAQITGDLPGEFDVVGEPKAKKVATATEALTKAKIRLGRAQEDLNKAESKGTDPAKLAAAEAHLTAAQANLQKAQYVGGTTRIASAQAAVDQAQARVDAMHKGTDTTSQQRRVADAKQAVTDARQKLGAAQGPPLPTARDLLRRATGNTATERGMAADEAKLGRFGLSQQFLKEVDDLDKQIPGTLHRVASTMTKSLARQINKQGDAYNDAAKAFTDAFNRAAKTPAEAVGANLAQDVTRSFAAKMKTLGFGDIAPSTNPFVPTVGSAAQQHPGGVAAPPLAGTRHFTGPIGGVQIQTVNVTAQNPQQLASALADQARHRALGGQTGLARP